MISRSRPVHFFRLLIFVAVAAAAALIPGGGFAQADRPARAAGPDRPVPQFRGNILFSDSQLQAVLVDGGWKTSSLEAAIIQLQQLYFREGYLFAQFRLEQDGPVPVLMIDEGEVARYGRTILHGAALFSESEIRRMLGLETGGRFNPRELDRDIEELLGQYDSAGYPFAQVWVDSLDLNPDAGNSIDLVLYVIEGGRKMLQEVRINGLKKTRPDLAVELSGLKTGEPYSAKSIEDAYLRLKASSIFEEVRYPVIKLASGRDGVEAHISLREPERFNTFSFALGYVRQDSKDDEVLSGNVRLNLQNIGGTLRDFNIFWNNDGLGKNETRLAFKDRFILGRNLRLGIQLEQVGLDTLYTWQSVGLELERPFARIGGSLLSLRGAVFGDRNVFSKGELLRSWRFRAAAGLSLLKGSTAGRGIGLVDGRVTWARKKFYQRGRPDGESLSQMIVEVRGKIEFDLSQLFHIRNETVYRGGGSSA